MLWNTGLNYYYYKYSSWVNRMSYMQLLLWSWCPQVSFNTLTWVWQWWRITVSEPAETGFYPEGSWGGGRTTCQSPSKTRRWRTRCGNATWGSVGWCRRRRCRDCWVILTWATWWSRCDCSRWSQQLRLQQVQTDRLLDKWDRQEVGLHDVDVLQAEQRQIREDSGDKRRNNEERVWWTILLWRLLRVWVGLWQRHNVLPVDMATTTCCCSFKCHAPNLNYISSVDDY